MTTSVSSILWRAADATENYNWMKAVSDAFDAVGFALHTDSGQINLTTGSFALPTLTAANTHYSNGVQIRKLVSSGKTTIYARIDYGLRRSGQSALATNNVPSFIISFATDTNGASLLAGVGMAASVFSANGNYISSATLASALTRPMYISSDGQNFLTMLVDPGLNNVTSRTSAVVPMAMCVERTISPTTLAYDNDGVLWLNGAIESPAGYAANTMCWMNFVGGHTISITGANVPCQAPPYYTSSAGAGNTHLFPITVCIPAIKAPMKSALFYYTGDVTDGTLMSTSLYSETHTFVAGGQQQANNSVQAITALRLAFRHD